MEWYKTIGYTNEDQSWSIQQTSDSGYIIAGHKIIAGNHDVYLIKLEAGGIDYLLKVIEGMPDEILADEIENSFVSNLENALKPLDKEKDTAAINVLQAFINQVEAQMGKKISEEAADVLISYANSIISKYIGNSTR